MGCTPTGLKNLTQASQHMQRSDTIQQKQAVHWARPIQCILLCALLEHPEDVDACAVHQLFLNFLIRHNTVEDYPERMHIVKFVGIV